MAADPRLLANALRARSMEAVRAADPGHPGMPMGMADAAPHGAVPAISDNTQATSHKPLVKEDYCGRNIHFEALGVACGPAIGLDRSGSSAPAEELFQRFGFTAEAIVPQILAALKSQGDQ
jgi:transketolase